MAWESGEDGSKVVMEAVWSRATDGHQVYLTKGDNNNVDDRCDLCFFGRTWIVGF